MESNNFPVVKSSWSTFKAQQNTLTYSRMPVLLWHSKPRQRHHKNKTMGQYPYEYGNKNPSNKQKESSNT